MLEIKKNMDLKVEKLFDKLPRRLDTIQPRTSVFDKSI